VTELGQVMENVQSGLSSCMAQERRWRDVMAGSPITFLSELDIVYTCKYLVKFRHLCFELNLIPCVSEFRAGA